MECNAHIAVSPENLAPLNAMSADGMYEVLSEVSCELDDGHPGPHYAIGQAVGDDDYWIAWTEEIQTLEQLPPCDAELNGEFCLLMLNHFGSHSTGERRWTTLSGETRSRPK